MLHLVPRETGGSEIYARRLVPALLEHGSGLELTVFAAREVVFSFQDELWVGEVGIIEISVNVCSCL